METYKTKDVFTEKWLRRTISLPEEVKISITSGSILITPFESKPLMLHEICGYEYVRRALEVALVQKHSMVLIGNAEANFFARWGQQQGLPVSTYKTCPCGNYQNPYAICMCAWSQIEKYMAKLPQAEITLRVPYTKIVSKSVEHEDYLLQRVKGAIERVDDVKGFDRNSQNLLDQVKRKFYWDIFQEKAVEKVAISIAALDNKRAVEAVHVGEAIQYLVGYK